MPASLPPCPRPLRRTMAYWLGWSPSTFYRCARLAVRCGSFGAPGAVVGGCRRGGTSPSKVDPWSWAGLVLKQRYTPKGLHLPPSSPPPAPGPRVPQAVHGPDRAAGGGPLVPLPLQEVGEGPLSVRLGGAVFTRLLQIADSQESPAPRAPGVQQAVLRCASAFPHTPGDGRRAAKRPVSRSRVSRLPPALSGGVSTKAFQFAS